MSKFKHIQANPNGKDFICGDIHGCFSDLKQKLHDIGFNYTCDRLYCLGDMIDRGDQSDQAVTYLYEDWFFSIMGNHELLCLFTHHEETAPREPYTSSYERWKSIWCGNGGYWWEDADQGVKDLSIDAFRKLPIAIQIDLKNGKSIGLVHADLYGYTWQEVVEKLSKYKEDEYRFQIDKFIEMLVWERSTWQAYKDTNCSEEYKEQARKILSEEDFKKSFEENKLLAPIEGIDHIFHGHTIVNSPLTIGNQTFIDTGSYMTLGEITVIDLEKFNYK